jgi:hypothetical protein
VARVVVGERLGLGHGNEKGAVATPKIASLLSVPPARAPACVARKKNV